MLIHMRKSCLALGIFAAASVGGTNAQDLTVAIDSASTFDLQAVYVAPAGTGGWQEVPLAGTIPRGADVVAGGSGAIVVPVETRTCVYDLRFQMDSDVTFHDFNVDLCENHAYTLHDLFE